MDRPLRVLLVDDEPAVRTMTARQLQQEFAAVELIEIAGPSQFKHALATFGFDAVVCDYKLGWTDGLSILESVKVRDPGAITIFFTGSGSEDVAVQAMKAGADDYVPKTGAGPARLAASLRAALDRRDAARHTAGLHDRLASLLDRLKVGVFRTTLDGRVLEANRAFRLLLGLGANASAGESIEMERFYLRPDDRLALVAQLTEHGSVADREVRLRRADGREIWVSFTKSLTTGGPEALIDGLVEEITERRRIQDALEHSEATFRSLVENALDVVTILAFDGTVKYLSPSIRRVTAFDPKEMVGTNAFEYVHPEDRESVMAAFLEAVHHPGSAPAVRYRLRHRDGSWRIVESIGQSISKSGGEQELLVYTRDHSERQQAADDLRRSEERFLQAQKLEAVGRLAGGVAHDFNNLLTAISGYAGLAMTRENEPGALQQDLEEIMRLVRRGAALTRQLLAFGRREVPQPQVVDLNGVVAETENMLRRVIGEDVTVELALATGPLWTRVDPAQLQQAILNLAVNARDAMPSGGRLLLQTAASAGTVELRVADTGEGMAPEILQRAFEPFFTTKEQGRGTGLGLFTVRSIVTQSGGEVTVESAPGAGSTFRLRLPQSPVPPPSPADKVAATPQARHRPTGSETVLLVEDESAVREILRLVLREQGYAVLAARGGHEALRQSESHDGPIHLLVTDVVMPEMSGPELARRLTERRPETRVLYLTGYAGEEAPQRVALTADAVVLEKPFPHDALAQAVRNVLDGKGRSG